MKKLSWRLSENWPPHSSPNRENFIGQKEKDEENFKPIIKNWQELKLPHEYFDEEVKQNMVKQGREMASSEETMEVDMVFPHKVDLWSQNWIHC